jgi:ketosteroid isomerase-like protein
MNYLKIILGLIVIGFVMVSCTPSAPSTLEIMDTLKTKVNERDLEGVVALFAEDGVYDNSYINYTYYGTKELEVAWGKYFRRPFISEFRDISVEGDSATFIWAEVGTTTKGESYTELWPTNIEVENGKITYIEWYEDSETIIGDE